MRIFRNLLVRKAIRDRAFLTDRRYLIGITDRGTAKRAKENVALQAEMDRPVEEARYKLNQRCEITKHEDALLTAFLCTEHQ